MAARVLRELGTLTPPREAWRIILSQVGPLPSVARGSEQALGHVLAGPVLADRDLPPADRSTMDGYAVRAADVGPTPARLSVRAEIAAGDRIEVTVGPGECARVFTGANMPSGADAVVKLEDTSPAGDDGPGEAIVPLEPVAPGAHVVRRGAHAARGDVLIEPGAALGPAEIAILAAVGCREVEVVPRPSVSILCTGAELRDPGAEVGPHQTRDSNGPMIEAALRALGVERVDRGTVPDDLALIVERLRRALESSDVVVLSGGVSVGKYDLVSRAVAGAGASVHVHGVRMKPGKPFLFATAPGGRCIFGLPGNPQSALTALHEFVIPAVRRLAGASAEEARPACWLPLASGLDRTGGRDRYLPARVLWTRGGPKVEVLRVSDSGNVVTPRRAEGMVIVAAASPPLEAGEIVEFRPWSAAS